MKLTPMDINNKEFKRVLRGYSPEEVDEFLDEVVESYEELFKEKSKLEEKLAAASEQINHYSKIETTIQNTLLLAQNAADSAKETAQREADLMLKNANEAAKKLGKVKDKVWEPNQDNVEIYNELYEEYKTLHTYFGTGINDVMKHLNNIRERRK